jgi:hypothetical protein
MMASHDKSLRVTGVVAAWASNRRCVLPEQNLGGTAESQFRVARADNGFEGPLRLPLTHRDTSGDAVQHARPHVL